MFSKCSFYCELSETMICYKLVKYSYNIVKQHSEICGPFLKINLIKVFSVNTCPIYELFRAFKAKVVIYYCTPAEGNSPSKFIQNTIQTIDLLKTNPKHPSIRTYRLSSSHTNEKYRKILIEL